MIFEASPISNEKTVSCIRNILAYVNSTQPITYTSRQENIIYIEVLVNSQKNLGHQLFSGSFGMSCFERISLQFDRIQEQAAAQMGGIERLTFIKICFAECECDTLCRYTI